ncbi:TlpA family protein disulfide reductase [Dyadobacter flavalbus]|uniref:TlpA family protein disulfide reductase n=1 Tax=Dyadobacter flavalbus TaxID=2579942 RepID=A0A5M8QVM0_9BACT|nr:TlpA disulfide reductase family protein [Dyadobacter flavalbus]KAA6439348.1 TlpA family protein disulfide reductase [Dyadobacter flavalbus]
MLSGYVLIFACAPDGNRLGKPVSGTSEAASGFNNWWKYHSRNIRFYEDFTPFDTRSSVIPLDSFMAKYATGQYIVLKYVGRDAAVQYKLQNLEPNADENIRNTLKSVAYSDFQDYQQLGKVLPDFHFTDINGNRYTAQNTKGKFVILKCWFIGCKPCVAEMPELNKLVASKSNRDDMLFLSLAFDSEQELKSFLARRKFDYKVVGNQKTYLNQTLNIRGYPTHMVINKEGLVERICNSAPALRTVLADKKYL